MMILRHHNSSNGSPPGDGSRAGTGRGRGADEDARHRLNLLLSAGAWDRSTFAEQLPRLLDPMGIYTIRVGCGDEATDVIRRLAVHIAVVDLDTPLSHEACEATGVNSAACAMAGGPRILQMLRRLDQPPPTVVVRPRQAATRESVRSLAQALREGAFAVLDQPVNLETFLEVLRRILRRHYQDVWPAH